jgi:hypothetical protein
MPSWLTENHVRGNMLDEEGGIALAGAIKKLTSLVRINVR